MIYKDANFVGDLILFYRSRVLSTSHPAFLPGGIRIGNQELIYISSYFVNHGNARRYGSIYLLHCCKLYATFIPHKSDNNGVSVIVILTAQARKKLNNNPGKAHHSHWVKTGTCAANVVLRMKKITFNLSVLDPEI